MALIWSTSSGATGISLCRWTIGCTSKPMTAEPRISTFGICSLGQTNEDRKSTRLNSSHSQISYAVFCLKKKKLIHEQSPSPVHQTVLPAEGRRSLPTQAEYP